MFQLPSDDESYPTPCHIQIPRGAETETGLITVRFRVIGTDRWAELSHRGDGDLLVEIIAGWDEVYAAGGKEPLACTEQNIRLCAAIPYFAAGVVAGYTRRFSPLPNFRPRPDA